MLMLHICGIPKKSTYLLYSFSVFGLNAKGRETFTAPRPKNPPVVLGDLRPRRRLWRLFLRLGGLFEFGVLDFFF